MLSEILKHEVKRRSFGSISFAIANGGGSATAAELKRFVDEKHFVVCICDTDLIVPGGARSATYNAVMAQSSRLTVPGLVAATPGREIENFLPIDVIEVLYSDSKKAECQALRKIFRQQGNATSNDCVWLYLDLKSGIAKGKLKASCNTREKIGWALAKFNAREEVLGEIEVPGLGEDIIDRYFDSHVAQAAFHKFSRTTYWSVHFSDWLDKLLWGTCGRKELRTG